MWVMSDFLATAYSIVLGLLLEALIKSVFYLLFLGKINLIFLEELQEGVGDLINQFSHYFSNKLPCMHCIMLEVWIIL